MWKNKKRFKKKKGILRDRNCASDPSKKLCSMGIGEVLVERGTWWIWRIGINGKEVGIIPRLGNYLEALGMRAGRRYSELPPTQGSPVKAQDATWGYPCNAHLLQCLQHHPDVQFIINCEWHHHYSFEQGNEECPHLTSDSIIPRTTMNWNQSLLIAPC